MSFIWQDNMQMNRSDNSFFHEAYRGKKVVVFSPHEDDEINIAGMLLYALSSQGAEIFVVYATNGDWKYSAKIREQEAVKSLSYLGISEDHAIFLGYGDSFKATKEHLFYNLYKVTVSPSGHSETYGPGTHKDYSFLRNGLHHEYTRCNFVKDIISVIEDIHPDLIVCNDLDEHPDHRLLSVCLDEAITSVIHHSDAYRPLVWKSLAYACAYNAEPDYSCFNNPETRTPMTGVTEKYQTGLVNSFYYDWDDRVRVPVPPAARSGSIVFNLGTHMLRKHRSQFIVRRADRIVNSDQVFWERRTDSLSAGATITATSGSCESLKGFSPYKIDNIEIDSPFYYPYGWIPYPSDACKTVTYSWAKGVLIRAIRLFPILADEDGVFSAIIRMSDGYEFTVHNLRYDGKAIWIDTGSHEGIEWCTVSLKCDEEETPGLALCEMFDSVLPIQVIKPYIKILIKDTFAYNYFIDKEAERLPISLYRYRLNDDVKIEITEGLSSIKKNELVIDPRDKRIKLTACSVTNRKIFDLITITRMGKIRKLMYSFMDSLGNLYMKCCGLRYKIARKWYSLKKKFFAKAVK